MDESKYTFNSKIRLLGYYNYPNQVMKPETEYVEEAKELARLLTSSINSLLTNPETDEYLKTIIKDGVSCLSSRMNRVGYMVFLAKTTPLVYHTLNITRPL